MALKTFRYKRIDGELFIDGEAVPTDDASRWFAPLELVADGSLSSLRRAMTDEADEFRRPSDPDVGPWGLPATRGGFRITEASIEDFDRDYSGSLPIDISLGPDGLVLDVILSLHNTGLDEDDIYPLLAPLLERNGSTFLGIGVEGAGTQAYANVRVSLGKRGSTVGDAYDLGASIIDFIERFSGGRLSAQSAFDLCRAGRADLLIGLAESEWLEAKSQGYDLASPDDQIEAAQDLARFGNGDVPALLVIGLMTKKRRGIDTITAMRPSPRPLDAARYHRTFDRLCFPPVQGLALENVAVEGGFLLAMFLPAQPEESKPFLVHGAIVHGKVEGAFISIVQRRGEHSVPTRPESIHATLAAGRALLRRGVVPEQGAP